MSIRVGKYDYKSTAQPTTEGYRNVLIHTSGQLSPYTMKDENGVIMENFWQFSKIWERTFEIKQPISQYDHNVRWEHPAELHYVYNTDDAIDCIIGYNLNDGDITHKYWEWRNKGFAHDKWVRYPVGHARHGETLGSVIGNVDKYEFVDYIEARKRIYFTKYKEIAVKTDAFRRIKKIFDQGGCIQINEVDGPTITDEYPYNTVVGGSIEITPEILIALINNPSQAFGHGYALAACLMGVDLTSS